MAEEADCRGEQHLWQIRVTQILDPSNFHAQFSQDYLFEHFELLENDIQTFCDHSDQPDINYLEEGMTVLAYSTILDKWSRAEVVSTDNEARESDLIYIDYGHSELRSWDLIITEFDPKFLNLPRMAYMCCLAEVKPLAKTWISRAVKYFSDLVLDEVAKADVFVVEGANPLLTRIYVEMNGKEVSVADLLVEEEFCLPVQLPVTPNCQSPANSSSTPKVKNNFDLLFKDSPRKSDEKEEKSVPAQQSEPTDVKHHSNTDLMELKLMFGDELVDKVLHGDDAKDVEGGGVINSELSLEQQIRKMRHRRMSPETSRRSNDVVNDSPGKRRQSHSKRNETPPRQRKVPLHARKVDTTKPKEELFGVKKDRTITSIICDLSEIADSKDIDNMANCLDHLLYCFQCYILDSSEILNPEELCNDLRTFLDKSVRHPSLLERFMSLVTNVHDHETFPAAVVFALPRVIEENMKGSAFFSRGTQSLCAMLSALYTVAVSWPGDEARLAVHDLILNTVQKWLEFCLKTDSLPSRVSLYCACLDSVLPSIGAHVSRTYVRAMDGLVETMRDIVLCNHVCRSDRELMFDLVILESRGWKSNEEFAANPSGDTLRPIQRKREKVVDSSTQTSDLPYHFVTSGPVPSVDNDVGDVVTSQNDVDEDEDFVDVRLMLLELNLSQYLDDMKQCGITDSVLSSPDIDLAGLMLDFQLPTVVAKRILLHLGRDLPPWLLAKIAQETAEKSEQPRRPDWSLYRDPNKSPARPIHVSQLGDFLPKQEPLSSFLKIEPLFKTQTMDVKVTQVKDSEVENEEICLNDESFPPLQSNHAPLVAPPKVTRVKIVEDRKIDHFSISELAKEIIGPTREEVRNLDVDWREKDELNADTDDNWRKRSSNQKVESKIESQTKIKNGTETGSRLKLESASKPESVSGSERAEPKHEVRKESLPETPERVNLVALCHDTGALDFKFEDENNDSSTDGLNAVVDLFTDKAMSPVTRGTRSRPTSSCSKKENQDTEKSDGKNECEESRGDTPTSWSELVSDDIGNEGDEESDSDSDSICVIIRDIQARQEAEEERQKRIQKYLDPKPRAPSTFKGFAMVCTNCGSKEHGYDLCPYEKKLIFS